jgi:hypothetical protein
MKLTTRLLAPVAGALLLAAPASAGTPAFSSKPSASVEGGGVRIKFAAAAACDAEVTVLAADGREVRHLAAGMLGAGEAAAPLVPGRLDQSLVWDRRDDRGRAIAAGAFRVRVRLGMKPGAARPLLKAPNADKPWRIGKIIVDPDPADAGRPGLTAAELATAGGKELAKQWTYDWHLMSDKEDDRLYAAHGHDSREWYRHVGATGKTELFDAGKFLKHGESFRIGPDGEIHVNPLRKLTRDLEEIPPPGGALQRERCNRFSMLLWCRWRAGPFVEHWRSGNRSPEPGMDGRYYMYICLSKPVAYFCVFDTWEKERALREGFQPWLSRSGKSTGGHFSCLRVDAKGKVYIAAGGGPEGKKLPDGRSYPSTYGSIGGNAYGSIVRLNLDERWAEAFPLPMGAPPEDPEELKKGILWSTRLFVPRVEKCYPGVMSWLSGGCTCAAGSVFDLDEYGRLYVPAAGREAVVVLDNAGNEILCVGKTVAAGPEGKGAKLHMGWPHRVVSTRRAIYFGEGLSRRVIRVGLAWAAEETCSVQ